MIFSQWQPDGGYVYYESEQRHPLGDDLPEIELPSPVRELGIPAQDAGYPLPQDARRVGEGDAPVGVMTPMARGGYKPLGDSTLTKQDKTVFLFIILAFSAAAYANWSSKHARSRY